MKKAVKVIAVLATLGSIVYFIFGCLQLSWHEINWISFLTTDISLILSLILLWALHNALDRIENLEKEVFKINNKQRKIDYNKEVEEESKPYKKCKACGAIERTNEDCCPMCNTPYEESQNKKKLTK